jgi:hypothetical protein
MKKLLAFIVVVALLGFYVAWPAWSGYRIHRALEGKDAAALAAKIDFPAVRASLRPAVTAEMERLGGPATAQMLKQSLGARLVDSMLDGLVTPQAFVEVYSRRGEIKEVMAERMGRSGSAGGGAGGLQLPGVIRLPGVGGGGGGGPVRTIEQDGARVADKGAAAGGDGKAKFSYANIKSFRPGGLASWVVGVGKDPAASEPDLVATMSFTGSDWKVTSLAPRARP